ncbi:MAG: EAL domain-containing protein [Hyphomicrobiaceae bacterium]|nr:EAL domain-containing protein [Bauldia sp.]MCB1548572.1 EAL domain-containing protein [Hyphomicrobiaceae bacterium]
MATFLLIAALGVAIGMVLRVTVLIIVSVLVLAFMFVTSMLADFGLTTAILDAVIGVVVLQLGYVAGAFAKNLASRASRQPMPAAAMLVDHADVDRPLSALDTAPSAPVTAAGRTLPPGGTQDGKTDSDLALDSRLQALFRRAHGFMVVLRGPAHTVESANEAFVRLFGGRDVIGKPIRDALPELAGQGYFESLDRTYATGEPLTSSGASIVLRRSEEAPPEQRFIDFVFEPIRDKRDRSIGVFVEGNDVTATVRADVQAREMERLAHATIDALPDGIAVIDSDGRVVTISRAWKALAAEHDDVLLALHEGVDYLAACDSAARSGDIDAGRIAALVRSAQSKDDVGASVEYERAGTAGSRWFAFRAMRIPGDGPVRIVLANQEITERKVYESRIEYLATHDAVTEFPNQNLLTDRARQIIDGARRSSSSLAVLAIDLDSFKQFKDGYGHATSDAAIRACAERIGRLTRPGDTVARIGSDEFVMVLNDLGDVSTEAARMARSILDDLSLPFVVDERELTLSASLGISVFPGDGEDFPALLKNAEAAVERAKSLGGGNYQFCSPDISARANERVLIEGELRRALRLEQLELHFQPQVEMRTGALVGIEALARWRHPELGWLPPARFIPIAEKTGLIAPIGRFVLLEACRQMRAWQREGVTSAAIAVNITASQLRDPDFPGLVEDVVAEAGIDPGNLELEITEGMMMEVTDSLLARLASLKRLGVRLSIDDFGTGYSNLAYLRTFPLDRLKVDRSFIAAIGSDEGSRSIVRAILGLGQSFGLDVIAEGVETNEQAALLSELGCTQAQGYLYAAPMRGAELAEWILSRETLGHPAAAAGR